MKKVIKKIISGLFLIAAIVFLITGIVNILDLNNITHIDSNQGWSVIGVEILINVCYFIFSIICLIVSSSLYIIDIIKSKK